jgi:hypothetical protein
MKYLAVFIFSCFTTALLAQSLKINALDYFEMPGLNVTVFSDFYPDGHQTGVSVIQHGVRVAANGDVRLEPSPGQWSPVPKGGKFTVDRDNQMLSKRAWYPDSTKNRTGFNPIDYPDLWFAYEVRVEALEGGRFKVIVDLDEALPADWIDKVGFNFELFPGHLFGKSYLMDDQVGIFPTQPNGPMISSYPGSLTVPLAIGKKLVVAPEMDAQRMVIETKKGSLELWDGRSNHNNGWYIVRTKIPAGASKNAVEWIIQPNVIPGWKYKPVIQVSQLGYHPSQPKRVFIELDKTDATSDAIEIYKLTENGKTLVLAGTPSVWGNFLRYRYLQFDFTEVNTPGIYQITYGDVMSHPIQIHQKIYDRHAWQPVLDYYLPVQMCHMRINDQYRVWHGLCHDDDALMAKTDIIHFDGYKQGPVTMTKFKPLDAVPGLNKGGWHDAGDYDLRVESQIGTVWKLAMMIEEFGLDYDATAIDQERKVVEIHVPDGKSDALQQIEHGLLTVLGGYRALGRLYRGIICPELRQYTLLGDGSTMTDNLVYNARLKENQRKGEQSGVLDDRWVFTEDNPARELQVAAGLAAANRVLKDYNPQLAEQCLTTALAIYSQSFDRCNRTQAKVMILSELILSTNDHNLKEVFIGMKAEIQKDIARSGWAVGRVIDKIDHAEFKSDISETVKIYQEKLREDAKASPYGVPYRPNIWGAGWTIQRFGVDQYFFHKAWPEYTAPDFFLNALNFVLGVHPGENNASFASGVGSNSVLVAYGVNRADWSFIPGGVASGTALIRPDLPEMKIWPFFWQQTEYVMGGGSTNYMFLVLAANDYFNK